MDGRGAWTIIPSCTSCACPCPEKKLRESHELAEIAPSARTFFFSLLRVLSRCARQTRPPSASDVSLLAPASLPVPCDSSRLFPKLMHRAALGPRRVDHVRLDAKARARVRRLPPCPACLHNDCDCDYYKDKDNDDDNENDNDCDYDNDCDCANDKDYDNDCDYVVFIERACSLCPNVHSSTACWRLFPGPLCEKRKKERSRLSHIPSVIARPAVFFSLFSFRA